MSWVDMKRFAVMWLKKKVDLLRVVEEGTTCRQESSLVCTFQAVLSE